MKSAYEIAMERAGGIQPVAKLSDRQKEEIAEIENKYRAKIGERETFLNSKIQQAKIAGNRVELAEFEEQLRRDVAGLKAELEQQKNKVWQQAG